VNNTFLETIKALDGEIFHLFYHQERYESVLKSFGVTDFKNLEEFLNPPKKGLYRCRVLYTKDDIQVTYHPYSKREINKLKLIYDDTINYDKKYANRENIDKLFALRGEADEILMVKNTLITDTSIANIAFYSRGEWFTPTQPLLKGTTRSRLIAEGKLQERNITVEDLAKYSKIALLNAMIDFDIISENTKGIYC